MIQAREDMLRALKAHADNLSAPEMLALTSHLVGQLVAFQDQTKITPAMAMALVSENIQLGNREAIAGLTSSTGDVPHG